MAEARGSSPSASVGMRDRSLRTAESMWPLPGMHTTSFCLDLETGTGNLEIDPGASSLRHLQIPGHRLNTACSRRPHRPARGQQPRRKRGPGQEPHLPRQSDRQYARSEIRRARGLSDPLRGCRDERQTDGLSVRRTRHLWFPCDLPELQPPHLRRYRQQDLVLGF